MRRFFDITPLMILPISLYVLFAITAGGGEGVDSFATNLERSAFAITMPSGAPWGISGGSLLVILGLFVFFYETIRGVAASRYAIIHHTLSVLLALSCLGAFLVFDNFATSTFFILSLMCILDMVAGVIANIAQNGGNWGND